ncbi:hypothetical protein M427DRAFT_62569, partial [Gonapodya prolifera JEL478]
MAKTRLAGMYEDGRGGMEVNLATAANLYTEAFAEGDLTASASMERSRSRSHLN